MEIKIQKENLLNALYLSQSVIEHRTTMPILTNALLETGNKSVTFTATDLQIGLVTKQPAESVSQGKVLVPVKNIYDIVKELPSGIVSLKKQANNWIEIVSGKSKFKIMGAAPDEFPKIPVAEGNEISLEAKDFIGMVEKVSYAMSNDETRYTLNGVMLESKSESGKSFLRMVATDGHRLSYSQRQLKNSAKLPKGVILPKKGVWELKKLLANLDGVFNLKIGEKTISAETENTLLVCRLIDGNFPPYESAVPKENNKILSVGRQELIQSLRRTSLVANEKSRGVKFSISSNNLDITSSNPDIGEAHEEISCSYKGEKFDVGFNASYFLDILGVLEDEKVVLELKSDTAPCIIRSEFDKGFLSVVMPMRM